MITSTGRVVQYALSYPFGTDYAIPYKFWSSAQIHAVLSFDDGTADLALVLSTDYTLSAPGDTGTLTKVSDWNHAAVRLTIYRELDLEQETDYRNGEAVDLDILERDFDYAAARDQQISETVGRGITVPITDPPASMETPPKGVRANTFFAWDADSEPISALGVPSVPTTAFMATLLDDANADEARSTLGVEIGVYDASLTYTANDLVTYAGIIYRAIRTTVGDTPSSSPDDWIKYAEGQLVLSSGSPLAVAGFTFDRVVVNSIANPFIINLPQVAGCVGYRLTIVNGSGAVTGILKINPYSGDAIGSLGTDVSVFLQNVDASGVVYRNQYITLLATASGYWSVVGGQFCPDQSVDTDGEQYHLGKLHHLPLNNTTSRNLYNAAPPTLSTWSSAINAAGLVGIPTGCKGIRAKVKLTAYNNGAGIAGLKVAFSDNNSSTPSETTAHPAIGGNDYAAAAGVGSENWEELDIPLNSSGQFYAYTFTAGGVTIANSLLSINAVGFYMGD